jgi:hypothetical protein
MLSRATTATNGGRAARINKLDDLARGDKPPFLRHAVEAYSLKEQGYELQAVTSDDEKDGHQFVVTFMLAANFKAALKDAEPFSRRSSASIEHRWPVG